MTTNIDLKFMGLTDKEQRVYIALLEDQGISAHQVSKKLNIPRSLIYQYLNKLLVKGLIRENFNAKRRIFFPATGEDLTEILNANILGLKKIKQELPKLISKNKKVQEKSYGFDVYYGKSAIKLLADLVGTAKGEVLYIGGLSDISKFVDPLYMQYTKKRRKNLNIDYRISDLNEGSIKSFFEESDMFTKRRFLPAGLKTNGCFAVYQDKILIAKYHPDFMAIVIEEPSLVDIFKLAYFALWKDLEGKNIPQQ